MHTTTALATPHIAIRTEYRFSKFRKESTHRNTSPSQLRLTPIRAGLAQRGLSYLMKQVFSSAHVVEMILLSGPDQPVMPSL